MRSALVLLILATLAAACGKKQPPASPTPPPTGEQTEDAGKATEGAPAPDTEATPRSADPCEGGE